MKKGFKKIIPVALVMIIVLSIFTFPTYASDNPPNNEGMVAPCSLYISRHDLGISISGITAKMYANLDSNSSISLRIVMELQKLKSGSYETIATYTNSGTGYYLSLSESRLINALSTYRLKVTFTAGSETEIYYAYPT